MATDSPAEEIEVGGDVQDSHGRFWAFRVAGLEPDTLYQMAAPYLPEWVGERYDETQRREIVALLHDHIDTLSSLAAQCDIDGLNRGQVERAQTHPIARRS